MINNNIKTYHVYLIAITQYKEREIHIPIRGISEEDVKKYVETELIPEIKTRQTAIIHFPGTEYQIDRIALRLNERNILK